MTERRFGRAAFLSTVALGGAGILFGDRVSRAVSPLGGLLPDDLAAIVPADGWRIYAINPPWPTFDMTRWRLEVTGAVETPLSLTWEQLAALRAERQTSDFHCVTGWSVDDVRWEGVRLEQLWDIARPTADARYLNVVSMEQPYVDTLTFEQAGMPDVMLAHTMDGAPLSRAHGAPLRLVVPKMYGYKSVKWVRRIELVPTLEPGYWERNGYDVDAWVGSSNGY